MIGEVEPLEETIEISDDSNWPTTCRSKGCVNSKVRPHHHHVLHDKLTVYPCQCWNVDKPGTSPKGK